MTAPNDASSRFVRVPPAARLWRAVLLSGVAVLASAPMGRASIDLAPAQCRIVTPAAPNPIVRFAVAELQKHLALIGGVAIPATSSPGAAHAGPQPFPIYVGIRASDDTRPLRPEEARWRITPAGIWLYGDDTLNVTAPTDAATAVRYENRTGTLFAVYEFLEQNLGVRWIEPGDAGIAFEKRTSFSFTPGAGAWNPGLNQRHIRSGYRDIGDRDPDGIEVRPLVLSGGNIPYAFIMPSAEFLRRREDELIWHRRMRMGRSQPIAYGHAFTQWWRIYGRTHPEYFALNRHGKREPDADIMQGAPERIKLCVSNPDLVREIVRRHFATNGGPVIDACENDSRGFCRCENCLAWDVLRPGEEKLDVDQRPLTDRYLRFANAIEAEAKKYNPAAKTAFYAYSQYHFPPRREKVADGVIVFFITGQFTSDAELKANYQAWKAAGAKEVYLRPNHLCDDTGMPLGFEQNMFEKFQLARQSFPLEGVDYDCSWGFRPTSGIAEYIMARAFYQPNQSFAHWEDDYCSAFGAAHEDIRAYHRYWRQIWNQRIDPNRDRIKRITGRVKEIRDKLMQVTDLLYDEADFDRTDALLAGALLRDISPSVRTRIQELQLANQHSRITYRARKANELASTASPAERMAATRALLAFRKKHRDELNIYWEGLFYVENTYNDVAGTLRLSGRQPKRLADWAGQMAASIRENRDKNEPPLR
jgi:hypothetical protein